MRTNKQGKQGGNGVKDRGRGEWLIARYMPVSLFSLRAAHATSKGGKTLLAPTPYAVKMALINAAFRCWSGAEAEAKARRVFDMVKWREVRVEPPEECVVQNTFLKVLDAERDGDLPFKNTIAYREFVQFEGAMAVALAGAGLAVEERAELESLFRHISYFGKRGSFWQFTGAEWVTGELLGLFSMPLGSGLWKDMAKYGVTQALDDFGPALCEAKDGFDRISTYGAGEVKLNEHRVLTLTALPYQRRSATRRSTWYQRL